MPRGNNSLVYSTSLIVKMIKIMRTEADLNELVLIIQTSDYCLPTGPINQC